MERLGFVDQVMHKVGTAGMPALHMQGAMVIDPATSKYEINAMILAEHIGARLRSFDILRKKLVQDPLKIGDMRMIEDPNFDVWDHISFSTLPSPGDKRCLEKRLGDFSAKDFDHDRPLWQFEIIEGLEGGKIAIAQKLSHATMDGTAAMKVMMSIFDQEASPPSKLDPDKAPTSPDSAPSKIELLSEAVKENVHRIGVDTPKILGALSKNIAAIATESINTWLSSEEETEPEKSKGPDCYPTSVNKAISSNKRIVAVGIYETDKLKVISKAFGCKLNDLCLLLASEAMTNYFAGIGEELEGDYVFVMPMSTRAADDKSHGNALALSPISSHSSIKSLPQRLAAIQKDTLEAKAKSGKVEEAPKDKKRSMLDDVDNITDMVSPLIIDLAATLLAKLNPWEKINFPANGVMSNVAGPREAMFFAGMQIEYQIPMIPIFHKAGLSVGATSMGNHFSFGFHACGKVVKQENMHFLLDGLERAYQSMADAAAEISPQKTSTEKRKPIAKVKTVKKAPTKRAVKPKTKA